MINFDYSSPTKIIFGRGVISRLGGEAGALGKKALLLYGKGSLKKTGLYDQIVSQLTGAGIEFVEHSGVEPNPVLSHARIGTGLARREGVDFIVAAGGGSVIDEAKGIAAGVPGRVDLWDYYNRKASIEDALPIIAIQTLPATSSENNPAGVLSNDETGEKFNIRSPLIVPRVAILDPEVTFSIPKEYTAYACFDIISHLLEGYFTTTEEFCPVQDGIVEGMVKAVMVSLGRILKDPQDYDARASVMWAAAVAWNGIVKAGQAGATIPCHMLEHPMSGIYNIAHGAGLSIITPAWLKYKKGDIARRILGFGKNIMGTAGLDDLDDGTACDRVIEDFEGWIRSINCPLTFSDAGVDEPDYQRLTAQAMVLAGFWGITGYTEEDIKEIYRLSK